jgi:hypothetical protein
MQAYGGLKVQLQSFLNRYYFMGVNSHLSAAGVLHPEKEPV